MKDTLTIGLARMHAEYGEKRDFLPPFVANLVKHGSHVILEHGYGAGMGLSEEDYSRIAPTIQYASHEEVYQKDIVIVLRFPGETELGLLRSGACLISMVHYPTRPTRMDRLRALGVEAISLDSLKDDTGRRLVENLRSVAWNGLEVGFNVLHRTYPSPGLEGKDRSAIRATILGVGAVGVHAVQAASRYGNTQLWQRLAQRGIPGVQVTAIDYDLTGGEAYMRKLLSRTDILVDATQRLDPSKVVIPNDWIASMPEHAVLVDLSVDPYDCTTTPPEIKGIEGIPQGNLDQYVFTPRDIAYDRVPDCVSTQNRRHVASCYSWPGIHPKECMELYGYQVRPVMRTLLERGGVKNINPKGRYFERAIARAMLSYWEPYENSARSPKSDKET